MSKIFMFFLAILFLIIAFFYFISSSSYQNSLKARVNYFLGNYESSYQYAKKAYEKDKYNKMAFSLLTQSKIALDYENYIKSSNQYLEKINQISNKNNISNADKNRIKMMCEIIIGEYENLSSTSLTDEKLKKNAQILHEKFKQINNNLF